MIYIRRIGEIPDNSIKASKLAEGAVNLSTNKVMGQLPTEKLQNGAVNENKIANLSISTSKLKNQAVTIAKAVQAMKIHHFVGDETEVSVVGISEDSVKCFHLPQSSNSESGIHAIKLHINAEIKVTGAPGAQGTLKLYIDDELNPRIITNTVSEAYEMAEANANISDLNVGKHKITIKLVSDNVNATIWNDLIEIFLEK